MIPSPSLSLLLSKLSTEKYEFKDLRTEEEKKYEWTDWNTRSLRNLLSRLGASPLGSREVLLERLTGLDADARTPETVVYALTKLYIGPFSQYNQSGNSDVPEVIAVNADKEVLIEITFDDIADDREEAEADGMKYEPINEGQAREQLTKYGNCSTECYRYDIVVVGD